MMKKWKWLPSPAMAVAVVALMAASAGGTAYAITVTSADIVNGTIRNVDVHDNTLTGAKIRESTLGIVPNSDRLDGFHANQFVRKAEVFTGFFSCDGGAWLPLFGSDTYFTSGSLRFSTNFATFRCNVNLPHGARVTQVAFSVRDLEINGNVGCRMVRTNQAVSIGAETQMASVMSGGTPENVRLTTTSITEPVINNANFSYYLQCTSGPNSNRGLYGGMVRYRVNGQQGAAAIAEGN
jgi:hypothetical protein